MIIEAREDTITLRGSIKTNIWPAIQAAAALLLENHPKGIIIDCSPVTKITKTGAETFSDAFNYISLHNSRIVVAGFTDEILEAGNEVPGVRSQLPLANTVEEARASLKLEELTLERGKALSAAVVPMLGNWKRAVYHSEKLAIGENCELHLVDLIKVPRSLPLGSPQPERENAGQVKLEEARTKVNETRLKCFTHIERVRANATGVIDFMTRLKADFAVLSIDRGNLADPFIEVSEAMSLLETASFEISLIKSMPGDITKSILHPVIPAVGDWQHALEHACKLVSSEKAEITVIHMITIPRSEPINANKPDAEAAASDCEKEAARKAKKYNVKVNVRIERVRDSILGFLKQLENSDYDLAVVGLKRETGGDHYIAHGITEALLQEAPCETVFLRTADIGQD